MLKKEGSVTMNEHQIKEEAKMVANVIVSTFASILDSPQVKVLVVKEGIDSSYDRYRDVFFCYLHQVTGMNNGEVLQYQPSKTLMDTIMTMAYNHFIRNNNVTALTRVRNRQQLIFIYDICTKVMDNIIAKRQKVLIEKYYGHKF